MIPAFLAILVNDLPMDALVGVLPFEVVITKLLPSDISLSVIKALRAFDDIGRTRILLSVFRLSWTNSFVFAVNGNIYYGFVYIYQIFFKNIKSYA